MRIIRSVVVVLCLLGMTSVGFAATEHRAKATSEHQEVAVKKDSEPVNINTADAKKLSTLKNIGMKRAEAIVAYRKQHGDFKTANDLTKVHGISAKIVKMNDGMIILKDK